MSEIRPTHEPRDLASTVEMLLDKGVVINADIVVSVGERELLGVEVRAALASFETAAEYGLAFPSGTDRRRLAEATDADVPLRDLDEAQSTLPEAAAGGTSPYEERTSEERTSEEQIPEEHTLEGTTDHPSRTPDYSREADSEPDEVTDE